MEIDIFEKIIKYLSEMINDEKDEFPFDEELDMDNN